MNDTRTEQQTAPFTVEVPQTVLDDLADRLARTRWPRVADPADTTMESARRLVDHWRHRFDWRAVEARLNRWRHVVVGIDGLRVHAVHERAAVATGVPVLLVHGWPDSFARFDAVVDELTAAGHDVVVPSLPGFGFSDEPAGPLTVEHMAATLHTLMTGLGYDRYAVHGGDWGSLVAERIAVEQPGAVAALHLTDVPFDHLLALDQESLSDAERAFVERNEAASVERAYQAIQSAQPTLLALGLSDSPVALAGWLHDKYRTWTDREPDLDAVLTQVTLYWATESIRSSMRPYREGFGSWDDSAAEEWTDPSGDEGTPRAVAPTAFAIFPADLSVPPREYAERFFDVRRFTLMPRGGHFAAMEEPGLLVEDLVAFLRAVD